jgi:deoxyribose-phosphate aldolase
MDIPSILSRVDHTLLRADATDADIERLCAEALGYSTACVCVNPRYVPLAVRLLGGRLPVCTVAGFPLGAATTESKAFEAADAAAKGAREIDMVISIGDLKEGRHGAIEREIRAVRRAVEGCVLKTIVETCLLTDREKRDICRVVEAAGADYIKTSTGFSTAGATLEDVALFRKLLGGRVKIKAAGGMSSLADMQRFLDLGADRLGSSAAVGLARAFRGK